LTETTAAVDDVGTTYVEDESVTTAAPFELLELLALEGETVDAVLLFEPPQATTVVSSAQIMAPRRTV
jgi:hypothetical protein